MLRPTFAGIEIARRALQAHRFALDVTGHNIANANAPGYSRQVVHLAATSPYTVPGINSPAGPGQVGTGVTVAEVVRMRDRFVQNQINTEAHTFGYWTKRQQILSELELTYLEPSEVSMRSALDQFWESLQELSKNPESMATRSVVRERAVVLAETIRNTYEQFAPLQRSLDSEIRTRVTEINSIGNQIAALNDEIRSVLAAGDIPNDLYDRRDLLVEKLSQIVDVTVVERNDGMIAVGIGGVMLVDGRNSRQITTADTNDDGFVELFWDGGNIPVTVRSGELKALLEGRDEVVPSYIDQLNEFARTLIREINAVHRQGYALGDTFDTANPPTPAPAPSGYNFFLEDPSTMVNPAETIQLDPKILENVANIAASLTGSVGDGTNALNLAQLKHAKIFSAGSATPGEFLGSMIASLGVQVQKAERMVEHQEILLSHLDALRASVSGVSLDEEMTNMIQYQLAYAAASRMVTTMDEAIDTIVNRMGLVGR